jgi:cytochrome c
MKMQAAAGAILVLSAFAVLAQSPARSTWDGVYTDAQAERGKTLYDHQCIDCHGEELEGDVVEHPALAGSGFIYKWNGLTVADLFERIHRDMPMDNPGTLTRQKAVDLAAFLLKFNRFPSGAQELPQETPALREIRIDAVKPDRKK